ncbi:MAG: DUF4185 domain-containing protein [Sphingobacteriaceae bacterium]|nr:MAG: DUF4185 domain-containing protein [Sphingobacteriaceae bacterium]
MNRYIFKPLFAGILFTSFVLLLNGCKKTDADATETVKASLKVNAPPAVYIDTNITKFYKRKTGWIASDGGTTVKLSNGYVLWLYGDTYFDQLRESDGTLPCLFNKRSTAMYQPYNVWDPAKTKSLGPAPGDNSLFRSNKTNGYWNWPACGLQLGDTVYIYAASFKQVSGGLGFDSGGNDVMAKMTINSPYVVKYHTLQDFNQIGFTVGMEKEADGYVYMFGSKRTWLTADIYVARFPQKNPNAMWTFYDGTGWNNDVLKAKAIGNAPSNSNHLVKIKNKYVLFSAEFSLGCDGGKQIWATVASGLKGPFSAKKLIYTIPDKVNGHTPFFYLPTAHPEYINEKNEILLTYSINGYEPCVANCVNGRFNPDYYRPRGIRVPLKLLDASF